MAKKVEIEWTSKDEAIVRTLQRTEQGMESLMRKVDKVESASRKAAATTETGFDKATKKIAGMASALIGGGSLLTAVDMVRRANEEMIRQADEAAKKYDELFRKFNVAAGLSAAQGAEAQRWISLNAEKNAVPVETAQAGALGLIGAGFSVKDAQGSALNVLLQTQAAMNDAGKAPVASEQLAKQAAAYFTSQGMESNAANLQKLMEDSFALRAGAFELSDLAEMGKYGATFRGKLSQQEQLAAFGSLRDAMPAAEAGTAMRNMVLKLTAGGRTTEEALKKMRLKTTDTDLIGENFGTALDRIAGGLASLPEEEREPILKKMFEEAGVSAAKIMINERGGKYADYQAGMRTSAVGFRGAAEYAQSGPNAALLRTQIRVERRAAEASQRDDLFQAQLDEQISLNPESSPVVRMGSRAAYNTARGFGASQEAAARFGYGDLTGGSDMVGDARRQQARDERRPVQVEVINQQGAPAVNQNAARGFGR